MTSVTKCTFATQQYFIFLNPDCTLLVYNMRENKIFETQVKELPFCREDEVHTLLALKVLRDSFKIVERTESAVVLEFETHTEIRTENVKIECNKSSMTEKEISIYNNFIPICSRILSIPSNMRYDLRNNNFLTASTTPLSSIAANNLAFPVHLPQSVHPRATAKTTSGFSIITPSLATIVPETLPSKKRKNAI